MPTATVDGISAAIGVPGPHPFPDDIGLPKDPPIPGIAVGSRPLFARQVSAGLRGEHYVAAYMRNQRGQLIGPAVWQEIDPHTTFLLPKVQVIGVEPMSRVLTPTLGASYGNRPDPTLDRARDCARWAR